MKAVVIDDERTIRNVLKKVLTKEKIDTVLLDSGKNALKVISKEKPNIVFLDISLKDSNGIEILKEITQLEEPPYIVMISGHDEYNYLIEAMKLGAYDYIPKPFDINRIRAVVDEIRKSLDSEINPIDFNLDIVGKSPAMKEVFKLVGRVANAKEPVLLLGESGVGKEVIANLIHKYSNRANKPFVAINCAAIPDTLIESELFGYEKGSFTGADKSKKGKFLEANGGTLFLDEISEMSFEAQGKLLRVLQENEVLPIGASTPKKIDVRVISATNKDLIKLVEEGKFREDLFYRLSVFEIYIPPLRERVEDIPDLIKFFTKQALSEYNLKKGGFTPEAVNVLTEYDFPGNIRELKNIVFKMISLYRERPISPEMLPENIAREHTFVPSSWEEGLKAEIKNMLKKNKKNIYIKTIEKVENMLIKEALNHTNGNISEAAKYLGIHRNTIHRKIEELNISVKES